MRNEEPIDMVPTGNKRPSSDTAAPVSLYPILAVNFVGTLGFSIVLPFLVFLVTRWGGNAFLYGVMGATYSVFQLIGAPILGRWSDTYGRRKILLLSQLGTLASWGIFLIAFALTPRPILSVDSSIFERFALTLPLVVMFVARACDGITGGNVSVANAYLADITDEQHRAANFGRMAVAANFGFILGPAIAGLLADTSWGELAPVLAALSISVVATFLIAFGLPESSPCTLEADPERLNVRKVFGQEQKPCFEIEGADKLTVRGILRLAQIPLLLAIYFLVMLGFNLYYIAFPVYAATKLAWTVRETGIYFSVMSLLMAAVQGPVLGHAAKKWRDRELAIVGSFILAFSFLFFMFQGLSLIYLGVVLLALGNGFMWPSVVSLLTRASGRTYQGAVQGFASSAGAMASILGLLVGGALYTGLEERVFALSSLIILVVSVLTLWLSKDVRNARSNRRS